MATLTSPRSQEAWGTGAEEDTGRGWGWRVFAGSMIVIGGFFNIIDGLVGIWNSHYYASIANTQKVSLPVVDNIHAWGWAFLVFGILMLGVGLAVFANMMWARVLGVVIAGANMVFQLGFLAAFPFWAFTMIIVDILVIYGLVVHAEDYA